MTQFFLAERPYHTFFRDPHSERWQVNLPVENEDRAPDVTQKKGPHRISKKCLTQFANARTTQDVRKNSYLTRDDVIRKMRADQGKRQQNEYAEELGIAPSILSDIYKGRRDPGPKLLSSLGLRQVRVYETERTA